MESSSQAPHSGGSPWKGFLLTASFLSCWIQPVSAQSAVLLVVPNPAYGTVGSSVVLDIQGTSVQTASYTWYRSSIVSSNEIAFYVVSSGLLTAADRRLNVFSNGSLLISNLTRSDTDEYLVQFIDPTGSRIVIAQGHLTVYETASKPNISASGANVMENSTVVFTCVTEHTGMNILWFFNNALLSLNERKNLSENNQNLTIENVTREDAGSYQCEIQNLVSANRSDPLNLTVNYGPDNVMFSPSPIRDEIEVMLKTSLILVCQVESYPPAQYKWQVNGTVNSNFPDNTFTINNVSWEHSGKYTCLAWNNITNIMVSKVVTIRVTSEESPGGGKGSSLSGGAMAGIVIGVLAGMALTGAIIYFLFFRKTGGATKEHLSKEPSAPKHGEGTTVYENTGFPKGSALSAQGLGSSLPFPEVPSESAYQALDMSRVDVYEKIVPWKNPEA